MINKGRGVSGAPGRISDRRVYTDYLVAWISYGISDGLTIDHVHVDARPLRHRRNATVVSGVAGLRMRDPQSVAQKGNSLSLNYSRDSRGIGGRVSNRCREVGASQFSPGLKP